jgi:hypothetical protein
MEVVKSERLCQSGRVSQTILVETEVPRPIAKKDLILKAVALLVMILLLVDLVTTTTIATITITEESAAEYYCGFNH